MNKQLEDAIIQALGDALANQSREIWFNQDSVYVDVDGSRWDAKTEFIKNVLSFTESYLEEV